MPADARLPEQPPPFAEPAEGPAEEEAVAWLDSAYFEAEAERMEAEARGGSAGG